MAAARAHLPLLILLLALTAFSAASAAAAAHPSNRYLTAACNVTRYRALCVRSLAGFSSAAQPGEHPRLWARAAVSVALTESERVGRRLSKLVRRGGRHTRWRRAEQGALKDCEECMGDAVSDLHGAHKELRQLRRSTFEWQMSNVETWVSAALTSQDTCLDGLGGLTAAAVAPARAMVLNTTYLSSNALALINKLASAGGVG